MTDSDAGFDAAQLPTTPDPALRQLDRFVGRWRVAGDNIDGQVAFEWMEGGFFLMQHVDLVHDGRTIKGVEYIGYDPASATLRSRYFGNQAVPFDYTWEVDGDTLTIWGGVVGSPARFRGTFGADGTSNVGQWEWPGGGYASAMTRLP